MSVKPEALRLADWLEDQMHVDTEAEQAASELRRLHDVERQLISLARALNEARRSARIANYQDGHETVCVEPHLWYALTKAGDRE